MIDERSNNGITDKPKISVSASDKKNVSDLIQTALLQITPLFKKPLLNKSVLVFTIQFCTLLGYRIN